MCLTCLAKCILSIHLQRVCQGFYIPCQYRLYFSILTFKLNHMADMWIMAQVNFIFPWNALLVGVNSFKILYLFFFLLVLEIMHKLASHLCGWNSCSKFAKSWIQILSLWWHSFNNFPWSDQGYDWFQILSNSLITNHLFTQHCIILTTNIIIKSKP